MSDTALAAPEDVVKRLEEEPSPEMLVMIAEYLEDASDQARFYGREWAQATCPAPVRRMVAEAVARFMRNPDGFDQNRAGDETLGWQRQAEVGVVYFTDKEIERLQRLGNPKLPSFGTMQMVAWQSKPATHQDVYSSVSGYGGTPSDFPLFKGE